MAKPEAEPAQKIATDELAFAALFKCHFRILTLAARSIVHDPDVADDVVQTVMFRAWRLRDRWRLTEGLTDGLLRYLLYNVYSEGRRELLKQKRIHRIERKAMMGEITDPFPSPETLLTESELPALLQKAIDALPKRRGEIFRLWLFADLAYFEIAKALGISRQTAGQEVERSLEALWQVLIPTLRARLKGKVIPYENTAMRKTFLKAYKLAIAADAGRNTIPREDVNRRSRLAAGQRTETAENHPRSYPRMPPT